MSAAREEYEKKLLASKKQAAPSSEEVASDNALKSTVAQTGSQTMQTGMQQGNGMSTAGGGMMAIGAATANPYLMAGGAGLSLLGAAEQNKRNQEEAQRVAYNDRIMQRQKMMQMMAQQGIQ